MQALRELARRLLAEGSVKVVLGWEEGRRGVRPTFVREPAQADQLIFDHRCVHNLATYLSPRRPQITALGRAAVVVKACDAKAVAGLIRESQIKREDLVLIGVRCGGVCRDPASAEPLSAANVAPRCAVCETREPTLVDHLVGEPRPAPPRSTARDERIGALDAMTPDQRWAEWEELLSRCVRCHACRQVCPLCTCERCVADKSQPQWIETSPGGRSNLAWQMTRVLHLAGRCVDCGECERACPVDIPIGLLMRKVARVIEQRWGHQVSDDPSQPSPVGTFRTDDGQEFIL
jgi:formate dehydrogenase (coenzyme F420) beta subunit